MSFFVGRHIFWNLENPKKRGDYIVDLGGHGICLGFWDGEKWSILWRRGKTKVYGWIPIPIRRV